MTLTPEELRALTGCRRSDAQARELAHLLPRVYLAAMMNPTFATA